MIRPTSGDNDDVKLLVQTRMQRSDVIFLAPIRFTPDSKWIGDHDKDADGKDGLYRVSVSGGPPERLGDYPSSEPNSYLYISPDGRQFLAGDLTPPAYGTNGNSGRNRFRGPKFNAVDLTISKKWRVGERRSAEFRTEFFNLFNTPALANPSVDGVPPSAANFGLVTSTADRNNNIFGSGGPRHIQFGLRFAF